MGRGDMTGIETEGLSSVVLVKVVVVGRSVENVTGL